MPWFGEIRWIKSIQPNIDPSPPQMRFRISKARVQLLAGCPVCPPDVFPMVVLGYEHLPTMLIDILLTMAVIGYCPWLTSISHGKFWVPHLNWWLQKKISGCWVFRHSSAEEVYARVLGEFDLVNVSIEYDHPLQVPWRIFLQDLLQIWCFPLVSW